MIPFRPHHVLCAITYGGQGYSNAFRANMTALVMGRLRGPFGTEERLRFSCSADAICVPCPHRVDSGCEMQAKIDRLDERHANALDLAEGDILTWGEIRDRALDRIDPDDLDTLCEDCVWLADGGCKAALAEAKAERPEQARPMPNLRPISGIH